MVSTILLWRMKQYFLLGCCLCVVLYAMMMLAFVNEKPIGSYFNYRCALNIKSASINEKSANLEDSDTIRERKSFREYDDFETTDNLQDEMNVSVLAKSPVSDKTQKPSCSSLIRGDKKAIKRSLVFSAAHPYTSTVDYMRETINCEAFRERRGYIMKVTKDETRFPLAFSVVMYKDVEQTERLLRSIYRPSNHYCVHVDRDADIKVKDEMGRIVKCLPNVFMASEQIHVQWGSFTVIKTELICMRDLLKFRGWKYFINLTGQEFPLKTNLQIVNILKIMNGTNSIDADTRQKWTARWKSAWPPPHNITPYKGMVHAIASRDFVQFAINDARAKKFIDWLKKTIIPDESFFGTLDNNKHLSIPGTCAGQVATDYKNKPYIARFKNMGKPSGLSTFMWPCKGKRIRQVCIWGVGDLAMLTSRRELFTNKLHINFEPQTFECIEEWHRNMTNMDYLGKYKMDYSFYRNMPQLKSSRQ